MLSSARKALRSAALRPSRPSASGSLKKRASGLYAIDTGKTLRKSYENPSIVELYDIFLGEPGSEKAHELLHTHYAAKLPRGIR